MAKITYEVVEHDGGWAYRMDGVFSETFPSHDMARKAAERAAGLDPLPQVLDHMAYGVVVASVLRRRRAGA